MKLKARFSIIALLCGLEMAFLTALTMAGANFIQRIQNFQFKQQECQYALADITNYLNQTISWSTDTTTIYDVWKQKIVSANKKFRELAEDPVIKFFPSEFSDQVDEAKTIWTRVVTMTNPFNAQLQSIQQTELKDNERGYISRNGIKAGAEMYEDSENVQAINRSLVIIEQQMKDLTRHGAELQGVMDEMYKQIVAFVATYTRLYRLVVAVLGVIFIGLVFVSIIRGTNRIIKGIKRVRDMSRSLAQRDFTCEIEPQGSNEMQALMRNMNDMVYEINNFFLIVKKTASRAISSGYSINDSSTSTAAATNEINSNVEEITMEFDQISESMERAVRAINSTNDQVKTLVHDNRDQTAAIDESSSAISSMATTVDGIRENAVKRSHAAEEMRELVSDGDNKISATNAILEEVMGQLDEIGEVVTLIDSITEQTNLLSMNAAIESAHAGEFGKGFAVVAEEIRSLAESTADNAQKINEAISNTIKKVTEAHSSSRSASAAFTKVSRHAAEMIDSFALITREIATIGEQTKQITQKTDITALAADKINSYCTNLAAQQETVAQEINSIRTLFQNALSSIHEISRGTEDIVTRMDAVGSLSKESYKNMTDLENVLEEFKTNENDQEELQETIDESAISNIISEELMAQLDSDFHEGALKSDDIDFEPDDVEEISDDGLKEVDEDGVYVVSEENASDEESKIEAEQEQKSAVLEEEVPVQEEEPVEGEEIIKPEETENQE